MKVKLEILIRDIAALAGAISGRGKLVSISQIDEHSTGLDDVVVEVDFESEQRAFWAGAVFQELKRPYTEEELADLQARYEYEHNL